MRLHVIVATVLLATLAFGNMALGGALARIYICPGDMTLRPGMRQQFTVVGLDSAGNEVPVPDPITWSVEPYAGSITSTGLFTADSTQGMFASGVSASTSDGLSAVSVVEVASPYPNSGYYMESSWGNLGAGHLDCPKGIAVSPNGTVYVSDYLNNRIQSFDSSGNYITMWGRSGSGSNNHAAWNVGGIAIDSLGNVLEADYNYSCIRIFSATGAYIKSVGSYGSGNGQFLYIKDVAIDHDGFIYGLDNGGWIQKFDSAGNFVLKWGSNGSGADQFNAPYAIAAGPAGRIYVTDIFGNSVKIFSTSGVFLGQWSVTNLFSYPNGIDVDANGYVYVCDDAPGYDEDYRIRKFDPQGNSVATWGFSTRNINGIVMNPQLSVSSSGDVYVVESTANTVLKFNPSGTLAGSWGLQSDRRGQLNSPEAVCCSSDGSIYVLDAGNCRVQVFDAQRNFVRQWGSYGEGDGQLKYPYGMALGPDNTVYVLDQGVKKFDIAGHYLGKWGAYGSNPGCFQQPTDITVDSAGYIYVADTSRYRVIKFNSLGGFVSEWGSQGTGNDQFGSIWSIGTDSNNHIYVGDLGNNRIKEFDSQGGFIKQFALGSGQGQIGSDSIAVDAQGLVYVGGIGKIDIFDASGSWIKRVESFGSGIGRFRGSEGLAVDEQGTIYIADSIDNRVLVLKQQILSSVGRVKQVPDGQFVFLEGQLVTAGQDDFGDCFYIESPDRSFGIKGTGNYARRGDLVLVEGIMATVDGERQIQASNVMRQDFGSVSALGMSPATIGGGKFGLQDGLKGQKPTNPGYEPVTMVGPNNVGLLVRTWGIVRSRDTSTGTFILSDGGVFDLKCQVPSSVTLPTTGSYVSVTGISSTEKNGATGDVAPLLKVRLSTDIRVIKS